MTFADRHSQYLERANAALERWLPPAETHPERFHAALRYAVLGRGPRLRPLLVYATAEWLGLAPERVDGIAVALELVHAYWRAHDDLPALANDRGRGRPATHLAFDEATAILVGDALQAHAYFVVASDAALSTDAGIRRQMVIDLARCSGSGGLAGGRARETDTRPAGPAVAVPGVEPLAEAALMMPCRLAPDAADRIADATRLGQAFGMALGSGRDPAPLVEAALAGAGPAAAGLRWLAGRIGAPPEGEGD